MKTVFTRVFAHSCLLVILLISLRSSRVCAQAQQDSTIKQGTLNFLDSTSGYGDLVLGADTRQMPEKYFSFLDNDNSIDPDSCLKYKYGNAAMLNFEEGIKLDLVGLRAYNNRIVNIYLFFKADDGVKMLKALQNFFGQPTDHPGDFMYGWTADDVNLQLRFETNSDLGVVIFSSKKMTQDVMTANELRSKTQPEPVIAATSGGASSKQSTIQTSNSESMLANTAANQ